jgi:hypothetical protein
VKIIPALKKELTNQQEKLFHQLKNAWQQTVQFTTEDVAKGKRTANTITIRVLDHPAADEEASKEKITELLQALNHTELLDDLLVPFVAKLKTDFISVLFKKSCIFDATLETLTLTYSSKVAERESGLEPAVIFTQLRQLVHFLQERLNVELSSGEEMETFLQRLGRSLANWLCDSLIRYSVV